ncbi:MAG: hypothetical protein LUO80_02615 [Methylococcaceae bacterium]|nr:hypothetical protein [Methylococcaceae bacterium]
MTQEKTVITSSHLLKTGLCALTIAVAGLLTTGCDSGSSSSSISAVSAQAKIEGYVSDVHGPILQGKLEVKDKNDKLILTQSLDGQSNRYEITVPAGTAYPILLVVTPPPGPVAQVVRAVVTSPLADRMDITDVTSLVVDAAFALGGLTETNIAKASGGAIGLRQRQGVSSGAGGGGSGAGQSAGGVSRGGHGGHDMSGGGGPAPAGTGSGTPDPMQNMQH